MCSLLTSVHRLRLALLVPIGALLASCAVPGEPQSGATERTRSGDASSQVHPIHTLFVSELKGRAWVQRDGRAYSLQKGSNVAENQPIQVGAGSIVMMQLGEHSKYELAANSRMVVHQLPRQGRGDARATWLRLEQGYLRIQWTGATMDPPMQVSFGIWAARLRPGDYVFDTRGRVSAVCAMSGSMRMSGVPEWTPAESMQDCTRLEANRSPMAIRMNDAQWSVVRAQRRLLPTLAQATRNRSSAAIARLEREQVRSPGPRPAAPANVAPPPVAVAPRTPVPAAPRRDDKPASQTDPAAGRERSADELIREAEGVRSVPHASPAPPAPRPPDPVTPAPAPSIALGPSPAAKPLPPLPTLTPRPPPITPPAPPPPAAPPEPVYEEPPRYAQHVPPVIVIPAEPEPEPIPPPAPADQEPPVVVVEPPRTQRTPPVIVIPAEPEPAPVPPPPPPPAVATAPASPPPPTPTPTPAPHTPPVIVIPEEPQRQPVIAQPSAPAAPPSPLPPPVARAEPPASSIELAAQSPVVIPPPSQPPPSDSAYRARGATPPSVPLDVAMYSVAAMPDKVEVSESALIVPPTITHEPANSQWLVNIASYPSIEPAQEHARMLAKQKLRAGVREQALPDRMSYLVVIEGFATEEAAETAAIDLEAQFDLDPY